MLREFGSIRPVGGGGAAALSGAPAYTLRKGLPKAQADWALFLDVDGTLAEIAPQPEDAVIGEETRAALKAAWKALGGAVALVSGRSIASLDALVAPVITSAAGLHGAERRFVDRRGRIAHDSRDEPDAASARDRAMLDAMSAELGALVAGTPGLRLEDKGRSLALHYRNAPEAAATVHALAGRKVAESGGRFELLMGKMVDEIKPSATSKGTAVARFMNRPPFRGRVPVFVGDDTTDEDGFATANGLGGLSIRVGPPPAGGTAALWECASVDELTRWLIALPDAIRA